MRLDIIIAEKHKIYRGTVRKINKIRTLTQFLIGSR